MVLNATIWFLPQWEFLTCGMMGQMLHCALRLCWKIMMLQWDKLATCNTNDFSVNFYDTFRSKSCMYFTFLSSLLHALYQSNKNNSKRYFHISHHSKYETQQTNINIYQHHRSCHYTYFIISFTELIETSEGNQKSTVCYRNYFSLDPGLNCLYDAWKCCDSLVPCSLTFMYIYSLLYPSLTSN